MESIPSWVSSGLLLVASLCILIFIQEPNTHLYHITIGKETHPLIEKMNDLAHVQETELVVLEKKASHLERLYTYLQTTPLNDYDIILYTAPYDTAVFQTYDRIRSEYKRYNCPILVCAHGQTGQPEPGVWIGRVWALRLLASTYNWKEANEQEMWSNAVQTMQHLVSVDTQQRVFFHTAGTEKKRMMYDRHRRRLHVKKSDACPCILSTHQDDQKKLTAIVHEWNL